MIVIAGADKGKKGEVLRVLGDKRRRVRTSTSSSATPSRIPQAGQPGGIVEREAPMHVSNVMLFNPAPARASALVSRCRGWTQNACVPLDR